MAAASAPSPSSARPLVAVTGASRGVGRALVDAFLATGWDVVACVRDPGRLPTDFPRDHVHFVEGRLDTIDGVAALGERLASGFPALRGLVNNAGVQHGGPDETREQRLEQLRLNVVAPVELTLALLPVLAANDGFVANVSSGLAYLPQSRSPVYGATKAALSQFTRSQRLASPAVRFHEVLLPLVDTDMTRGRGSGKISPADAAAEIVRGLERRRPTIGVGKTRMLPLMLRIAPRLLERMMDRAAEPIASVSPAPSRG